jgi:hypothetical protein
MLASEAWKDVGGKFRSFASASLWLRWQRNLSDLKYRFETNGSQIDSPQHKARFEVLARRAGALLDPTGSSSTRILWYTELAKRGFGQRKVFSLPVNGTTVQQEHGFITRAYRSSADLCAMLESEALDTELDGSIRQRVRHDLDEAHTSEDKPTPLGPANTGDDVTEHTMAPSFADRTVPEDESLIQCGFPNRARWLKARLKERHWDEHELERQLGPDHKTTQKILKGRRVYSSPLPKLVRALNNHRKFNGVKYEDIPSD